jgi:hypothetical protein
MLNGNYPLVYFGYYFSEAQSRLLWCGFILFIVVYKLKKRIKIKPIFVIFYAVFSLLIYVQNVYLKSFFLPEFINLTFLFTITYLIIYSIGIQGLTYLPRLMVKLIKWSLVFYIPTAILFLLRVDLIGTVETFAFQSNTARIGTDRIPLHTLFHNFSGVYKGYGENGLLPRNSGVFWEPGAFAGSIVMVTIFLLIYKAFYSNKDLRYLLKWLLIGLLSTFSTTGLLLIPVLILINYSRRKKLITSGFSRYIILTVVVTIVSYYAYYNIPVLNEKISAQIEAYENKDRGSESSRIGSAFLLLTLIDEEPIIGNGFAISNQEWKKQLKNSSYEFSNIGIGNGLFLILAWAGIPFVIFLLVMMVYNFKKQQISLGLSLIFIGILLLLLQGESWMKLPLIYSFCFICVNKISSNKQ